MTDDAASSGAPAIEFVMTTAASDPWTRPHALHVIGAGLIGTSIGLAAARAGWAVTVEDADVARAGRADALLAHAIAAEPGRAAAAAALTASAPPDRPPAPGDAPAREPDLVCVAVPPRLNGEILQRALHRYVSATVMDVCSVKSSSQAEIEAFGSGLNRLLWTHPLAGAEGSGPDAARSDLFVGRTWIVCATELADPAADGAVAASRRQLVERLVVDCGAQPLAMPAARHDELLAMTSHLPQLVSSALASEVVAAFAAVAGATDGAGSSGTGLSDAVPAGVLPSDEPLSDEPLSDEPLSDWPPSDVLPPEAVLSPSLLAGPGLLDMTRIAASPSEMWAQIAVMNRQPLREGLRRLTERLQRLESMLADPATTVSGVTDLVDEGRTARGVLDRKHAGTTAGRGALVPTPDWTWVRATIADVPGTLAHVFAVAGQLGVNIEDVRVDHAPYASQGLVSVAVRTADAERLARGLS